jgi:hypothetical protein
VRGDITVKIQGHFVVIRPYAFPELARKPKALAVGIDATG